MASFIDEWNPNYIKVSDFNVYVGNSVNECEEFVWRRMEDFRNLFGDPKDKAYHAVKRNMSKDDVVEASKSLVRQLSWYQGEGPINDY